LWSQKDYADARADLGYEIWISEVFLCSALQLGLLQAVCHQRAFLTRGGLPFFSNNLDLKLKKKKDWACLLDPSWHHCLESVLLGMAKKLIAHFPLVHLPFPAL